MAFRGLTVFIADVRAAKSKEAERKRVEQELANIRKKFRSNKTLDAYNKKKYVAKLVFCVLLGYEFDFGHMEAVELLSGATYGEKQMGYLFTSVLMNENHDLSTLLINSIQTDLTGRNEVFACLGLAAVANTGGKEMAEALAPTVQKLLFRSSSGGSRPFVQKKAALCLLRLYRRWPDCIPPGELTDRILGLLDSNNLGVVTASMALIQALVADEPEDYAGCVPKVIWLLDRIIIKREYPNDYVYKGVACPWLCVKLMRVLQYYPPPRDRDVMERLTHVLQTIVNNSDTAQDPKDTNHNNAYNAVLFEAIDLMIHLDSEPELLIQCAHLLGQFIRAPETNIRYLGLEKMAHLARSNEDSLDSLKRNQDVVIQSLKDNDISIRRRALDLLYHMCDRSSSAEIVAEMLAYLEVADHAIKDELVLKIAILAEKFAASWEWYVSTILELIALGGNYVSKEVWWRVVQIVTNNEDLQVFACRKVFEALQSPACHEVAIKVAGFLLGEFGHLLNEDPRSTVEQQFDLLHGKWGTIRGDTKAILLNAFSKYSNLFPEMQPLVLPVLRAHEAHINAELQQRACEYITLAEGDETLIAAVWDVMPAFPERDSAVIVAANRAAQEGMTDRGSAVNTTEISHEAEEVPVVLSAGNAAVEGSAPQPVGGGGLIDAGPSTGGSGGGSGGGLVDLLTGDVGGSNKTGSSAAGSGAPPITELLAGDSGVLFDDGGVQIGMKAEYRMHQARVELYHGNRTSANLNNFSAECSAVEGLSVRLQEIEGVGAGQQVVQLLALEATSVFQGHPVLKVCYNGQEHTVPVPVVAMKFITPYELDATKYLAGWNSLGADAEVQWFVSLPGAPDVEGLSTFLSTAFHLAVLPGIDPNTANLVSCGMFCGADAKIPVMLRVQTNAERQMACFTLRCTQPLIRAQVKGTVVANVGPETTL